MHPEVSAIEAVFGFNESVPQLAGFNAPCDAIYGMDERHLELFDVVGADSDGR